MKSWSPFLLSILIFSEISLVCRIRADSVTPEEAKLLRDEVREMFYHAFDGYMKHAFPLDELKPLSCGGEDTLGGYALTLIDSLDMLALLGDRERFTESVEWIGKNLQFDINKTVSVFETTIRILGGLLSAHLIASDYATGMKIPTYDDELLYLAEDLASRLLPAFDTPTGIPFGSVNLMHGVDENESKITSTAGGGTLTLEFGVLSRLTNNPIYEEVAKNAVRALWARRSNINLVGAHIDVFTGEWTQKDAGIGTSIDSFYEYLLKAYILFGDEEYLFMFREAYEAAMHYLYTDPWYVEVNMNSAALVWPLFNSLQAFWPGLQVLAGDIEPAIRTHAAFFSVWTKYGFTPEGFNLATLSVQQGQKSYPLRPELIESTYWLYKATRNPRYLDAGRDFVTSLQHGARCTCGYCHISDVEFHKQEDHMESFFLAETVKYLWLLFDLAVGPDNLVENGPYKYIFTTEGHLVPATPQISLVNERCSYLGSYCNSSLLRQDSCASDAFMDFQQTNDSKFHKGSVSASFQSDSNHKFTPGSGSIKGFCPGLTHGQKFGISYVSPTVHKDESSDQKETAHSQSPPEVVVATLPPKPFHESSHIMKTISIQNNQVIIFGDNPLKVTQLDAQNDRENDDDASPNLTRSDAQNDLENDNDASPEVTQSDAQNDLETDNDASPEVTQSDTQNDREYDDHISPELTQSDDQNDRENDDHTSPELTQVDAHNDREKDDE